ncbi:MAG: LysR family transcriptional regulator, partial [Rhodospirillales bacterium]
MVRRLPPLNALRVFEAAARHLSFTRAAGELNVTQAAVSHQIKSLEERLGLSLFRRINRGLLLTDEGQTMLVPVSEALDLIAGALERLQSVESTGILTVSVLPSFAAKWLVPRLGRFTAANPDIDIRLSTTLELVDFVRDGVDIAVRYGRGEWPDLKTVKLMAEDIFPVCSPA